MRPTTALQFNAYVPGTTPSPVLPSYTTVGFVRVRCSGELSDTAANVGCQHGYMICGSSGCSGTVQLYRMWNVKCETCCVMQGVQQLSVVGVVGREGGRLKHGQEAPNAKLATYLSEAGCAHVAALHSLHGVSAIGISRIRRCWWHVPLVLAFSVRHILDIHASALHNKTHALRVQACGCCAACGHISDVECVVMMTQDPCAVQTM